MASAGHIHGWRNLGGLQGHCSERHESSLSKELNLLRYKQKQIDDMKNGVWLEPVKNVLMRKCNEK